MLISFNGTNNGWGEYVINGTKKKPREHSKIKVLRGDIQLGDTITSHPNYRQNAYSMILSFKGKPNLKIMDKALTDFEELFMHGFSKNEYHLDAVLHTDTDDYHIHIRIPKFNLYTGTQLQLYLDKKDRKRVNLIRNLIDIRYKLESPQNNRQLVKEKQDFHIKKLDIYKHKSRKETRLAINDYIRELHEAELIENLDNIKQILKGAQLEVVNTGYDFSRDFHYITIKTESEKIRIKGDIYNEEFWKYSRNDRREQIETNKQSRGSYDINDNEYDRVLQELKIALNKRKQEIIKRYSNPRNKASSKINYFKQKDRNKTKYKNRERETIANTNNNATSYNNHNDELSTIYAISNKKMVNTKEIQTGTEEWTIYDYAIERFFLLKKKTNILLETGELNGTNNRNIIEKNSQIRDARKSIYRTTEGTREFIYNKAGDAVEARYRRNNSRKRCREKIVLIGEECSKLEQQFDFNLRAIRKINEYLEEEDMTTYENVPNQEAEVMEDYIIENEMELPDYDYDDEDININFK